MWSFCKACVGLALKEAPATDRGPPATSTILDQGYPLRYRCIFCFVLTSLKKNTIMDITKSKTDVSAQHIINYQLNLTHEFFNLNFYLNSHIHFLFRIDLLVGLLTCFLFFASTSFAITTSTFFSPPPRAFGANFDPSCGPIFAAFFISAYFSIASS